MTSLPKLNPTLLTQLAGTLLILAFLPTNLGKLAALLILWALTFKRITRSEFLFFVIISTFFTIMNIMSLKQGIFQFTKPDIFGMPYYEFFMWGFYLLHTWRMIGEGEIHQVTKPVWVLAILYSISFASISDQDTLFLVTSILLAIGLFLFHQRKDIAFTGYMIFLGAAIEYTGVYSGQWNYPENPAGGVPPWFITLWGGVGLFLHRLAIPLVYHFQNKSR